MSWKYETLRNPVYYISLNGKPLPNSVMNMVEEVTYENHATGSDVSTVTIADPTMALGSNPLFMKQTRFTLRGGYQMQHRTLLDGYITAVDYIYPEDNTPQLIIHAMDKSHVMDRLEKKRSWEKKTRFQVAQSIAKEYGFGFSGQPNKMASKVEDTITQSYQTDITFLISLADECEMIVYFKGNTIYFKERNYSSASQRTFYYRNAPFTLISFEPRVVQKDLPDEETEDNLDDKGKKENGKANDSTPSTTPGNAPSSTKIKNVGGSSKLVYENGSIQRINAPTNNPRHGVD